MTSEANAVNRYGRRLTWGALLVVTVVLLASCTTLNTGQGPETKEPRLIAQPFRSIGLLRHHVKLALGRYIGSVGPAASVAPHARRNIGRACSGRSPAVTWLGHSSAIIHIAGRCLLTDPVLETAATAGSPLPQRLVESPARVGELPNIDAIILSHGDYDHLHSPTIQALSHRFPDAEVLVPPGVALPVMLAGQRNVARLGLGETRHVRGLAITAAPAHHETRRTLAALKTGEAFSWIITDGRTKVLFIGDSGYGPSFSRHGPFDLLLVPIGAYEPSELVSNMHANPEQAVQISRDVGARLAVGIHWGTFALSPDRPADTVRRFMAAGREMKVRTRILKIGERQQVR